MLEIFRNLQALNHFKQTALNKQLAKFGVHIVASEYIHFANVTTTLSQKDKTTLTTLLAYAPTITAPKNAEPIIVVPRFGTYSPWSSKATDIVHLCGLTMIERIERGLCFYLNEKPRQNKLAAVCDLLMDKMTQTVIFNTKDGSALFDQYQKKPLKTIDLKNGIDALVSANETLSLALNDVEIDYLFDYYQPLGKNPTDAELMMFSQANSEHCRHKIFNAKWTIDGKVQEKSLFNMIKNTYQQNPSDLISVYQDNAAVMAGHKTADLRPDLNHHYQYDNSQQDILIKVETHNHPTAIAPFEGAATGSGGEIRDEGATGQGSKPKASLCGFSVSHLHIPKQKQPWEFDESKPDNISSALNIMIEAPIGAASYNNEFGRPNLCGYFRSFEQIDGSGLRRGFHKPIMIAGGLGAVKRAHSQKETINDQDLLIVLGGPAMLIGLGGGASSSLASGSQNQALDFASVQRANAEMQRRCQEVINRCCDLGSDNPIISIHDVGAGGLSNALPELVNDSNKGAVLSLRDIPCADTQLSPMEIWCNEAQERYVLAIKGKNLDLLRQVCHRERAPFAVVGYASDKKTLQLNDSQFQQQSINLPMHILFDAPSLVKKISKQTLKQQPLNLDEITIDTAIKRVLQLPTVASKHFLITIGDRSVGGLVARDQMVGAHQVPVADCAIMLSDFKNNHGSAMAMGERSPLALINPTASAKMAVCEALTNLLCVYIADISTINLSANWMAASGDDKEDLALFEAVYAIGEQLCPALGITIPVGKDSLSMKSKWSNGKQENTVSAPLSLIISAFAPVTDVRKQLSPVLDKQADSQLLLVDLSLGRNRLAGSALAQVYNQLGDEAPDLLDANQFKRFFTLINQLHHDNLILAYHDRSDGGVLVTLLEIAFASQCGLDILNNDLATLFNEELGCVIQVKSSDYPKIINRFQHYGLQETLTHIANINTDDNIRFTDGLLYTRTELKRDWLSTTYQIKKLRDNPKCVEEELKHWLNTDSGLAIKTTFDINKRISAPYLNLTKPKIAILREQGVNGHIEMAAAFSQAGFDAIDVHMSDLMTGKQQLKTMQALVACGGFSYGDVLGAGRGWAHSILLNSKIKTELQQFFNRENTFALGVCNGCQMLSHLTNIISGTNHWPVFLDNESAAFEARFSSVRIEQSNSILLQGMAGSILPVAIAHAEGRAVFKQKTATKNIALRYVDNHGNPSMHYPENPNGSQFSSAGVCSDDGRVTILMPHPERVFLSTQNSYHPKDWQRYSPWFRLFENGRKWLN